MVRWVGLISLLAALVLGVGARWPGTAPADGSMRAVSLDRQPELKRSHLARMPKDKRALLEARVGSSATDFASEDMWYGSEPVTWEDLRGRVVVVQTWSLRSRPSQVVLGRLADAEWLTDDVVVIGVHGDPDIEAFRKYMSSNEPACPVVGEVAGTFCRDAGLDEAGMNIVVDQAGVIRYAGLTPVGVGVAVEMLLNETDRRRATGTSREVTDRLEEQAREAAAIKEAMASGNDVQIVDAIERLWEVDRDEAGRRSMTLLNSPQKHWRPVGAALLGRHAYPSEIEQIVDGLERTRFADARRWLVRSLGEKESRRAEAILVEFLPTASVLLDVARELVRRRRWAEAAERLERGLPPQGEGPVRGLLARALYEVGRVRDALAQLERSPFDPEASADEARLLILSLERVGRLDRARDLAHAYLAVDPGDVVVESVLERLAAPVPQGGQRGVDPFYTVERAERYAQCGRVDRAIRAYRRILLHHPDDLGLVSRLRQLSAQSTRAEDDLSEELLDPALVPPEPLIMPEPQLTPRSAPPRNGPLEPDLVPEDIEVDRARCGLHHGSLSVSGVRQILLLNGPNLDRLGQREPGLYGRETLDDLVRRVQRVAQAHGMGVRSVQSAREGGLVEAVHAAADDGLLGAIVNAAAYTHTSVALRDAFLATELPFVEVHLSNVWRRETFPAREPPGRRGARRHRRARARRLHTRRRRTPPPPRRTWCRRRW